MKILVAVKQVPDTATQVKIGADAKGIDTAGITWIVSPYDEFAVEEALRIKEKAGQGEVVAVTLGPERAKEALRSCLAMGCDRAIHLNDPAWSGADTLVTARALAAQIEVAVGGEHDDQQRKHLGLLETKEKDLLLPHKGEREPDERVPHREGQEDGAVEPRLHQVDALQVDGVLELAAEVQPFDADVLQADAGAQPLQRLVGGQRDLRDVVGAFDVLGDRDRDFAEHVRFARGHVQLLN